MVKTVVEIGMEQYRITEETEVQPGKCWGTFYRDGMPRLLFRGCAKLQGLPRWLSGKESACSLEDPDSIPGLRKSSGGGSGNPLQYSCLGNPMDRGARRATVHAVSKSWMQLSD